jgi:hypothetical protein
VGHVSSVSHPRLTFHTTRKRQFHTLEGIVVVHDRYLGRIQSGMDVCDSRGSRLGSIARVYRYDESEEPAGQLAAGTLADNLDEVIEVKTGVFGLGKRLYVPFSTIQEVITDSVFLAIGGFDSDLDQFKQKPTYLAKLH